MNDLQSFLARSPSRRSPSPARGFSSSNAMYTVANLKADIGLAGVIVEAFDASAAPYYLQRVSDSYMMAAGEGYWVYVPSDVTWTING